MATATPRVRRSAESATPRAEAAAGDERAARTAALDASAPAGDFASAELAATGSLRRGLRGRAVVESVIAALEAQRLFERRRRFARSISSSYHARRGQGPLRIRAELRERAAWIAGRCEEALEAGRRGLGTSWPATRGAGKFGAEPSGGLPRAAQQTRFCNTGAFPHDHIRSALGPGDSDIDL